MTTDAPTWPPAHLDGLALPAGEHGGTADLVLLGRAAVAARTHRVDALAHGQRADQVDVGSRHAELAAELQAATHAPQHRVGPAEQVADAGQIGHGQCFAQRRRAAAQVADADLVDDAQLESMRCGCRPQAAVQQRQGRFDPLVRLGDLPTTQPQAVELTSDGTVWVLLPWTERGPFRIAHAKNGKAPWTTETIPLPRGSTTDGAHTTDQSTPERARTTLDS